MYLLRETNASRLPPSSPVAQILFDGQSAYFALNGINAVTNRLSDNAVAPFYLPNSDLPPVKIALDTESDTATVDQLRSLKIRETELLTTAQYDHSLRLSALFGSDEPTDGTAIVHKACELFAIPIAQVEREELFDQSYVLTKTIGFKRPIDISIPKDQPDGE